MSKERSMGKVLSVESGDSLGTLSPASCRGDSVVKRDETVKARIEEAPPSVKKLLAGAFSGSGSPRQAIKAQCLVRTGYERSEIKNCTGYSCPLWAYRPFQSAVEAEGEASESRNDEAYLSVLLW